MSQYQCLKGLYEEAVEAYTTECRKNMEFPEKMFVGEAMLFFQQRELPIHELTMHDIQVSQDVLAKCSEIYILKDGSRRCVKTRYETPTLPNY